jgi:glycerol-3-phosphate dehydrogenase (NAD(P)+)
MRLGKGETLEEVMKSMSAVAEGVLTSKSAHNLAKKMGVDCPVIEGIYKVRRLQSFTTISNQLMILITDSLQVIHLGENPLDVVASNMTRPLKPEVSPIVADACQRS